ncbi:nicotinamidase-related amidase [Thermocatellispora tengchongensis]|uniref:Nicotinamidase-related amidase n=1 Tax=Thermocatellispora tengchongensis TaxID=1073253 RepID=A0A840P8L9_9ACTN|nr:isochorismatase family protein [Thermocatellispora tengchongensis]MBB5134263.1 nicotinamidase-related amidase [Thermocatellispora tengchongensis]
MARTPLSADNAAIVLIDHAIGFSNLIGSHTIEENLNGTLALAKIAKVFGTPLVVTNGSDDGPAGPLYPELQDVLGDHPVIVRPPVFDAFDDENFAAAVEASGRRRLIMAGIQTDVCLALTALTAVDRGYEVYAVVDASAATTKETHDTAVMRLVQAGVIPVNWLAVGSELLGGWTRDPNAATGFGEVIYQHLRSWRHQNALTTNVRKHVTD